jgi:hypothetical protein
VDFILTATITPAILTTTTTIPTTTTAAATSSISASTPPMAGARARSRYAADHSLRAISAYADTFDVRPLASARFRAR